MNKQTVPLIALFAGWILTADMANATAYEDIAGQWCGDVTDYVFTSNTLTVKFHDDRPANVFKITKYTYTDDSVSMEPRSRSRFSRNSAAARWRSRKTTTNRAELSIAAENAPLGYLTPVPMEKRRLLPRNQKIRGWLWSNAHKELVIAGLENAQAVGRPETQAITERLREIV